MKKGLKIVLQVFLVLVGALFVLIFLAFSAKSEIVPDIYVTSESGKVALAVRGNYTWNSFSESVVVDNVNPEEYAYENNHILLVTPGEKMTFQNSENVLNCYKFYQLEMKYYDTSGKEFIIPNVENSKAYAELKYLEVNAPEEEGTYIYHFQFRYYNKGEVSYGLKVVVSSEPNYEIDDLIRYKSTSLKDIDSIQAILALLPYAKYKDKVIVRTNVEQQELQVGYPALAIEKEDWKNHAIALFILIPELDVVTYQTENETLVYTRDELENAMGRLLRDYANDVELWKSEILFKERILGEKVTRDEIYKSIINDILSENFTTDLTGPLILDTQSFAENSFLELSQVDRKEILEYASEFASVVYDMSQEEYDRLHSREFFIALSTMRQATKVVEEEEIPEEGKYICQMRVSQNGTTRQVEYEVQYLEGKWNILEL